MQMDSPLLFAYNNLILYPFSNEILLFLMIAVSGLSIPACAEEAPAFLIVPEPARIEMSPSGRCIHPGTKQTRHDSSLSNEEYVLTIAPDGIDISYGSEAALCYAQATLDQIKTQYRSKPIPCAVITDAPRYPWRGIMIDPARHFMPVEDIKVFIDVMAYYKFNRLHLHLTDDQGWRIPVPGYPRLETIASQRRETFGDGTPHGGFYTREQLKDIVAYAAARHVEVIPEIDAPGHSQALAAAYPDLICYPRDGIEVKTDGGVTNDLVCPGKPEVWAFYRALFKELAEIFPSSYVHLGGDEAPEDHWKTCPTCASWRDQQKNIIRPAANDDAQMTVAVREEMKVFFRLMTLHLRECGKQPLFWYEEPIADYPEGCIVYTWRMGKSPAVIAQAREKGLKVVCSPGEHAYFDYPQFPGGVPSKEPGGGWMPVTTLKRAYELDPGYGLPEADQAHIIGVEATLWGECIPDMARAFLMAYPRCMALAEAGWTPLDKRSWKRFLSKMAFHRDLVQGKWNIEIEHAGNE